MIKVREFTLLNVGDPVEIIKDKNTVVLKKYGNRCVFCDGEKEIIELQGNYICENCRTELFKRLTE